MVWQEIAAHRYGSMFISPIKAADAPNYYDIIKVPLDLKTIKIRIHDEEITTTTEFYRDVMHMFSKMLSCTTKEDSGVYPNDNGNHPLCPKVHRAAITN